MPIIAPSVLSLHSDSDSDTCWLGLVDAGIYFMDTLISERAPNSNRMMTYQWKPDQIEAWIGTFGGSLIFLQSRSLRQGIENLHLDVFNSDT